MLLEMFQYPSSPHALQGAEVYSSSATQRQGLPNYFDQVRLCAINAISHTAEEAIVPLLGLKQKPREYFADCLPGARGSKSPLGGI